MLKFGTGVNERSVEGESSNPSGASKLAPTVDPPRQQTPINGPSTTLMGPSTSAKSRPKASVKRVRKGKGRAKLLQGEPVACHEAAGSVTPPPPITDPPIMGSAPGVADDRTVSKQAAATVGVLPQGVATAALFDNIPKVAPMAESHTDQDLPSSRIRKKPAKTPTVTTVLKPASVSIRNWSSGMEKKATKERIREATKEEIRRKPVSPESSVLCSVDTGPGNDSTMLAVLDWGRR
ncbi:hypothetical protein LINPERHAP2_LOCUS18777 [Linum perenne]